MEMGFEFVVEVAFEIEAEIVLHFLPKVLGSLTFFANSVSRGERKGRRELIISTLRSLRTLREKKILLNLQKMSTGLWTLGNWEIR